MKKLMIAAATAAMVGGAFADAQVWEMSLTAKTTASKIGTVKSACDACDGATSYRKQASVKIAGVFWGCTCEEMYGLTGPVSEDEGVFFWNASKKAAFYDQDAGAYAEIDFGWDILNRIGQKAADCEGVWDLAVGDFVLRGAGFGKVAGCDDAAYIKSMNGSFAGTYIAGNGCKRCEDETASAWLLCDCGEADARTAAYGNWTLKYNASVTKKFRDSSDWSWYKWPGDTLEAIQELISGKPAPTPTPADLAKKNYEAAKKALADAEALVEDLKKAPAETTQGKALAATADAAKKVADDAAKALTDAGNKLSAETADAKTAADKYVTAYVNTGKAQAAYDKAIADKASEADIEAARKALAEAQTKEAAAKKAYEDELAKLGSLDKADVEAYTKAALADADAKAVKTAADDAVTLWAKAADADKKTEGTIAKARVDADDAVTKAKGAVESAKTICIIAGVICE